MMAEQLLPCPFCGNEHPEIAPGDSVICNTDGHTGCGCGAFYDRWNERTPGPATAAMREYAKEFIRLSARPTMVCDLFQAFIDEWPEPTTPPAPEQPAASSPWRCAICGAPVRISDDLQLWHLNGPANHDAELSDEDRKTLADGLRLTD